MLFTILYRVKEKEKEVLLLGSTIVTNACVFYFLANNKPSKYCRVLRILRATPFGARSKSKRCTKKIMTCGSLRNLIDWMIIKTRTPVCKLEIYFIEIVLQAQ